MARNFGAPPSFGALALQSNPAHYSGVLTSRGVLLHHGAEDEDNINKERQRRSGGSRGGGTVRPRAGGGGGVIIRSDGSVVRLNPAHYGSPDADDVQRGLAGAGAAGFGLMGALIGAAVGAGIQFRGKPLKDGWLIGSFIGFVIPVLLLAPKKEEAV